jgi:hypothetical protein
MGKCKQVLECPGLSSIDTRQYMDPKAGLCGVAFAQLLPPMFPGVLRLHEEFQKAMFQRYGKVDQ